MNSIENLIKILELEPHPEGGYFKETYRSNGIIKNSCLPSEFKGNRNFCTGIYYLLESQDFSAFHKINQDEMWHFYKGDALEIVIITEDGKLERIMLGNDIQNGNVFQCVVPKNCWFAAKVSIPNSFSLVGCTVSPGFDFQDFTLADAHHLKPEFPKHKNIIKAFTRS